MSITSLRLPETVADQGDDFADCRAGQWVSEADYWQIYYHDPDFTYEWNDGILEVKPMPDYLNYTVYLWFVKLLDQFLERYPIARPVGLEMGFSLQLPHKSTGRRPDLGVVLNDNPVPLADKDHQYQGIFDLCVESLSDSGSKEIKRDTVEKKSEYALAGVTEYYILDESGQHTAFYVLRRSGVYGRLYPTAEGVIQSTVLPGFQFRLIDLYRRPRFVTLVDDPVYQGFILPEYQEAKQQVKQEQQRVKQEQERATQEQERAEAAVQQATQEQERAETAEQQAKQEQERAEVAEERAEAAVQQAKQEQQRADTAEQRAETAEQQAKQEQERAETAEQQAKQEQERAETAEQQAKQEQERAERYAAKLKELGISLD